ncbi:MAG: hypothetical protein ACI9TH_003247 [Kiritimatiellia bacterium]|jgi:hypothetical protein
MAELILDLNDAGIRVAQPGSDRLLELEGGSPESPGYALITRKQLVTGRDAYHQALIQPLDVQHRFWDQLGIEPAAAGYNQAELACAHLQHIWSQTGTGVDRVWATVPAIYDTDQLGILYEICRELRLPLESLVAAPVLVQGAFSRAVHLDLGLHRCVFSLLEQGERIDLVHAQSYPNMGWLSLSRQWVKSIANEFVRTTRFDPLYQATSEQGLHARIEPLLRSLQAHDSTALEVSGHRITLMRTMMSEWVHSLLTGMTSALQVSLREQGWDHVDHIFLSDRLGLIPGVLRLIKQQVGGTVEALSSSPALALAQTEARDLFAAPVDGQVTYQTARASGSWNVVSPAALPPPLPPVS